MSRSLRFGILGSGNIARQFAGAFSSSQRCELSAIGSRSAESAHAFAAKYAIPQAFGSYDELIRCPNVDAVYVSLPNSMHHAWAIKALQAGKHVLCEKPLAIDERQAAEMFDVAARAGRLLVEAFMYRSHPLAHAVRQAVVDGRVGALRLIRTSFCFRVWKTAGNIRFDRALAGGALMDIGCYCINFSRFIAGAEPLAMHAVAQLHPSGVDELAAVTMKFPGDVVATFACGMNAQADNTAAISGTDGYIQIPVPWKPPVERAAWSLNFSIPPKMDQASGVAQPQRPGESFAVDAGKALYALEADDFAAAVLDAQPSAISRADSLGNMRVLDELRRQVGVVWEGEGQ